MKKIYLFILLIMFPTFCVFGQLSGPLSGTLGPGTFTVVGDISVQIDDSLFIESGTIFYFWTGTEFIINGFIYAVGTELDSIFFTTLGQNWNGISFNNSSNDLSILEYCLINGSIDSGIECNSSSPSISHCSISGNSVSGTNCSGGGIKCVGGNPSISDCLIKDNSAIGSGGAGGGIDCSGVTNVLISDCVISNNSAGNVGGAIRMIGNGISTILNCTISSNTTESGACITVYDSVSIANTIIEGNIGASAAIHFYDGSDASIIYSNFYNNESGNFSGSIPPFLGMQIFTNLNGDSCDTYFNIFEDPLFYSTTGDSAYFLSVNSPCIDAGDPTSPLDPDSTIADMGVYYFNQSPPPPPEVTIEIDGLDVGLSWSEMENASSYNVCFSEEPYAEEFNLLDTTPDTTYVDSNRVADGIPAFYYVKAVE